MRKWKNLPMLKKLKRLFYLVYNFLNYKVWGSYKIGGIVNIYHWIRCNTWNRYHILNLTKHSKNTSWGWSDRVEQMKVACFHLLCEYVEKEKPFEVVNWESDPHHQHAAAEIKDLYNWWKVEQYKEQDELNSLVSDFRFTPEGIKFKGDFEAYKKRSDELEEKEEQQLKRLLAIRGYLWT